MSDLVGNPEDRFSHNEAQLYISVGRSGTMRSTSPVLGRAPQLNLTAVSRNTVKVVLL